MKRAALTSSFAGLEALEGRVFMSVDPGFYEDPGGPGPNHTPADVTGLVPSGWGAPANYGTGATPVITDPGADAGGGGSDPVADDAPEPMRVAAPGAPAQTPATSQPSAHPAAGGGAPIAQATASFRWLDTSGGGGLDKDGKGAGAAQQVTIQRTFVGA